ncbi:potassium-transporting ATPase subunit F [Thermoleptolyngbya sp. M55_K2018_002]|uniref:potassium-transporting ATPase subunit F n=1 Tax=Thermoleptolyngbya sp. M55_K2018_002 TaxID=2747808 RepID=UPI0019F08A78|nr:potassium-transporting ATPase subunit F [Thermoleptolyngbya sp. M55_K2018_002]HIK43188.1 potassium-transporting ATPase subunit F [Thermoleptolyngbya sp. M55_K2018_002]
MYRSTPTFLFLLLTAGLLLAPAVMAATGDALTRGQSYAIALLGLVIAALSIYLFTVMFQPEKF